MTWRDWIRTVEIVPAIGSAGDLRALGVFTGPGAGLTGGPTVIL